MQDHQAKDGFELDAEATDELLEDLDQNIDQMMRQEFSTKSK